ncbi:non-specific lipid transfer protein GPI-anchored 5-like [Miscanthus floridulus]|uniref:non-specific lipid transfer protein GPI-anchored 5-like n=1 Tax=Miscanthus floridulus TaxID=154761 RepID=UPI003459C64D
MASSRASSSLALAVVPLAALLLLAGPGAAQSSSAPAPASGSGSCLTEMVSLYPCLGYISGNSTSPRASCCSALSSVVASNPRCLCTVLGGGASSLGVTVNSTRALELPGACNVKTPPPSECKSVGVPVPSSPTSPATTPSSTTPASTAAAASVPAAPAAAGTGTKVTQTAESSGGSTTGGKAATSVFPVAVVVLSAAVALLHA